VSCMCISSGERERDKERERGREEKHLKRVFEGLRERYRKKYSECMCL